MIRIVSYCNKCKTGVKEFNGKLECKCTKKVTSSALSADRDWKHLYSCEKCGRAFKSKKTKKKNYRLCNSCWVEKHNKRTRELFKFKKNKKK